MTAGSAVAAAASAKLQMLMHEEEVMTQYTRGDLDDEWEFKIVRANTMAFREPEALQKLVEQEARAQEDDLSSYFWRARARAAIRAWVASA